MVEVADDGSGVAGGQILVGGTPLPTTLARGRLTARLPSGNPRRADIRVTVTDVAGNSATGVPPRIDVRDRVRARNGRSVAVRGRLTTPAGAPLAGVALQATATIRRRGATAAPAGGATTDARGRFTLRLPAGPSRNVRLLVPATGEMLPRRPRRRRARAGLLDDPRLAPRGRGGHPCDVLGHDPARRPAAPAARPRRDPAGPDRGRLADLRGRPHHALRALEGDLPLPWRPGTYPVRLRIRRANAFPFELGYSPTTTIRVR